MKYLLRVFSKLKEINIVKIVFVWTKNHYVLPEIIFSPLHPKTP